MLFFLFCKLTVTSIISLVRISHIKSYEVTEIILRLCQLLYLYPVVSIDTIFGLPLIMFKQQFPINLRIFVCTHV